MLLLAKKFLRQRISEYAETHHVNYIFDAVHYCESNNIDRMLAFGAAKSNRFLYKNEDLKYQREYRLALDMDLPKDHFIRLGNISAAASYIDSREMRNMEVVIHYQTKKVICDDSQLK